VGWTVVFACQQCPTFDDHNRELLLTAARFFLVLSRVHGAECVKVNASGTGNVKVLSKLCHELMPHLLLVKFQAG